MADTVKVTVAYADVIDGKARNVGDKISLAPELANIYAQRGFVQYDNEKDVPAPVLPDEKKEAAK